MRPDLTVKLVTLVMWIASLPGCILIEYPLDRERWGRLPEGPNSECPDLSGRFRVVGEATETRLLFWFVPLRWRHEAEPGVRLDRDLRLLLDETRSHPVAIEGLEAIELSHLDADHVRIALHYDAPSVEEAVEPETLTLAKRLSGEDQILEDRAYYFDCADGMLSIRGPSPDWSSGPHSYLRLRFLGSGDAILKSASGTASQAPSPSRPLRSAPPLPSS
jgi:hypothetical protein